LCIYDVIHLTMPWYIQNLIVSKYIMAPNQKQRYKTNAVDVHFFILLNSNKSFNESINEVNQTDITEG